MAFDELNSWFLIAIGLVALLGGGELLVRGASTLAASIRIPPLVIGLTIVAFGTSAPELVVSLQAALAGTPDVAFGNVVGSNIFNVLVILGLSALVLPLMVSSPLIRFDVPLMIGISVLSWMLARDGFITRVDGLILFGVLIVYLVICFRVARRESKAVKEEFAAAYAIDESARPNLLMQPALVVIGLACLGFGSRWLVTGAVSVATGLGVSELVIGLTIVAAGTSLPEVVTSVLASIRDEPDIAVGNVVGSNIFNLAGVLGLSSVIAPGGIRVSEAAIYFDVPIMIVVALACLPVFFTDKRIERWEGALFLAGFVVYTLVLIQNP